MCWRLPHKPGEEAIRCVEVITHRARHEPLSELWRFSYQKWEVNRQSWPGQAMSSTVANRELVGRSQLPPFMRQPVTGGILQ